MHARHNINQAGSTCCRATTKRHFIVAAIFEINQRTVRRKIDTFSGSREGHSWHSLSPYKIEGYSD